MVIVESQLGTKPLKSERSLRRPPENPADFIFTPPHFQHTNVLPSPEGNSLEQARRTYMLSFLQDYPEVWEAWDRGRLLDLGAGAQNIIEHSVVAAIFGRLLARNMGLPLQEQHDVALALLVHDADRLIEKSSLQTALEKKWAMQRRSLEPMLTGQHTMLHGIVQDHIVPLASANVPASKAVWEDPRYQIVHYVDAILDGSVVKTPRERMRAGANSSGGRNAKVAQLRYKIHERALGLTPAKDGYGYTELQIDHADQEANQFVEVINQRHGGNLTGRDLPRYLQELFDQEVEQSAA